MMADVITIEALVSCHRFGFRVSRFGLNSKPGTRIPKCFIEVSTVLIAGMLSLLTALSIYPRCAWAQPLQKTVAMVGARSGASWPLWIAKDARLYAKYGLDVELVYAVHPGPIAAIISGHAAMTSAGSDPALLAATKDPSLVVLGGFMNKGSFAMIGSKSAADMKQLTGKKIGIGRVGDPPYHMALALLRKYGMTARDVQWVSVGVDASARAAALQSGQDAPLRAPTIATVFCSGWALARCGQILIAVTSESIAAINTVETSIKHFGFRVPGFELNPKRETRNPKR